MSKEYTNRYFELPSKEQTIFQVKLGLTSVLFIFISGLLLFEMVPTLLFLLAFEIAILLTVIAPFFDVPSLVKSGKLKYYSLFFLAESEKKGVIKIHGGTLFDYYFVFTNEMKGTERVNLILLEYLKGLKNLIDHEHDEVIVEGTSYILNERTASKVGLQKINVNAIQKFILIFNYVNLTVSASMAKRSLQFPNLANISTFRGKVFDIKKREPMILNLISILERKHKKG